MNIPILDYIQHLTIIDIVALAVCCAVTLYFCLSNKISILMSLLILSAALVSTTIPILSNIASLTRWLLILLLLLSALLFGKLKLSFGVFLFWGYVFWGFVSLLNAPQLVWEIQRGTLLLIVAMAIPFAFGDKPYTVYKQTLILIAFVAAIYAIINSVSLPASLGDPERFRGYSTGVPVFANTLGALLPFTLWGAWKADSVIVRILCGVGFVAGTITLILSGQRTGTVAGLIGLVPLLFAFFQKSTNRRWAILFSVLLLLSGYFIYLQVSPEKMDFLFGRYSASAGLSGRDLIWQRTFAEITKNPFWGRGIGAAETLISNSFHNAYLEAWYNTGLIGLMFFLVAEVYYFQRIFKLIRVNGKEDTSLIFPLSLGYMLGFILLSTFESEGSTASSVVLLMYIYFGVFVSNQNLFDDVTYSENLLKAEKA
jgi:O-antigen ligase